jgi:hypothetical protein
MDPVMKSIIDSVLKDLDVSPNKKAVGDLINMSRNTHKPTYLGLTVSSGELICNNLSNERVSFPLEFKPRK